MQVLVLVLFCVMSLFSSPASAQSRAELASVPPELRGWVPWVKDRHPERRCAVVAAKTQCIWPGLLSLQVGDQGGNFSLTVRTDKESWIPLPYARGAWPQGVRIKRRVLTVVDRQGVPSVKVGAGKSVLVGQYSWKERPTTLQLPGETGVVDLRIGTQWVVDPKVLPDGTLRVGTGIQADSEENRLVLDVSRKIEDGVPLVVHTRIDIRASGSAREVNLGQVLLANTQPVQIDGDLPSQLDESNNLIVRVRPGNHTLSVVARHDGPTTELAAPALDAPWPEVEFWAVQINDRIRAANFSGPPGIDAARTTLPSEWQNLTTFQVRPGTPLAIEELRRGEPNPAPNQLSLNREFWLDHDGGGWTVRDRFSGTMTQGWRLNIDPRATLGHVADHGVDQVITNQDETGIELRNSRVSLLAESRIETATSALSAVGWDTDVNALSARVHLPPGYSLLTATGVDNLSGSVLDQWNLWDLFFVLILAMAIGYMTDIKWGVVALMGLVLARHEPNAPAWLWVALVVVLALAKAAKKSVAVDILQLFRWFFAVLLLVMIATFSVSQVRNGLFPQLDDSVESSLFYGDMAPDYEMQQELNYYENDLDEDGTIDVAPSVDKPMATKTLRSTPGRFVQLVEPKKAKYLSAQVDPNAVVQTGPGIPTWDWQNQPLTWSGPVDQQHEIRLILLSPLTNALLAFLRVALLLGLALRLCQIRKFKLPKSILPVGLVLLLCTVAAPELQAAPSEALLDELDTRLFPPVEPSLAEPTNAVIRMTANQGELTIVADVHSAAITAWPIPGPTSAWVPDVVKVDGRVSHDLARLENGFLSVRLEPGTHTVQVMGPVSMSASMSLQFGVLPKRLEWRSSDWELTGQKADGTVDGSVMLIRTSSESAGGMNRSAEHLAPWLEVHRTLDLGIPWRVRTSVTRKGANTEPLTAQIPLVSGEAITTAGFEVHDGTVAVTMERGVASVEWLSTLDEASLVAPGGDGWLLELVAPEAVPWTERWTMSCSPVFRCAAGEGPAPLHHVLDDLWSPEWLVWPGEQIAIAVARPQAAEGQTVTIDEAELTVAPGRRQQASTLTLQIRSSQGGHQLLGLPPDAQLQSVTIDGRKLPLQSQDGNVRLPLKPGSQRIAIAWLQLHATPLVHRTPEVQLGGEAVNATVTVEMPEGRWIIGLAGPVMGPVPLFWVYIVLVLLAAPLLARLPNARLKSWQWALLCLGMTQVHLICPVIVILWLMAMGHREKYRHPSWWAFDLWQMALIGLTGLAAICLYFSIHAGLLWTPDMQVQGNGSWDSELIWYTDRVVSAMPQATIVSCPIWVWRVGMLLWSLWLAASLVFWLPWAWRAFSKGGVIALPPKPAPRSPAKTPTSSPAAPSEPASEESGSRKPLRVPMEFPMDVDEPTDAGEPEED